MTSSNSLVAKGTSASTHPINSGLNTAEVLELRKLHGENRLPAEKECLSPPDLLNYHQCSRLSYTTSSN